ncbi:MAG: DNA-directed RNA polymerase subunit omega [Bdellovibrionales bacterium]|nr:DNA-directed RNA polymerase subunit omega [Bdellovibrionales bacterium]NQZ17781.1 DNA-directed RNA polymerase subunit omega [Bdellovibrionales bacterium]
MARVTVEDCLEKVDNRFALVHLVSKRAKQLLKGSQPVITRVKNKYVVTALREVASGLVQFDTSEENANDAVESDLNPNIH